MDEETKNWTSLDLYYKGFHIKKSWGENISRVTLMAEIDGLIAAGFKPSWNEDTNKTVQAPVVAPVAQNDGDGLTSTCKVCGGPTKYKEGVSKSGKAWKGWFCPKDTKENPHPPFWIK